ncbi:probable carboxylesterase 17 [Ananas comosus]|uniref:Probable carboxylesterase 17 n=1 Tax=Ananas comosus TaxID=4615 RepID=A0A6P5GRJ5_ANACO|nr:probable carboxylesterase 17 [Ananas comosus]
MVAVPHNNYHGAVADEIEGLVTVYEDGHVERAPVMPTVESSTSPLRGPGDVTWSDVTLCRVTGLWARLFVPDPDPDPDPAGEPPRLPVVVYFHGGGFCVGSAAWRCYHDFAARLAASAGCAVASVDYRLAPEHPLPAAYDDGAAAVDALLLRAARLEPRCDPSRVVLCGDSAGAAIAYHVAARLCECHAEAPGWLRGVALVQPFFGGQARTASEESEEKEEEQRSVLSLGRSDGYCRRLALPRGCDRDHPWCNPVGLGGAWRVIRRLPRTLVCAAGMDVLRDRNAEFCAAMKSAGNCVESRVYAGVGHAFQLLGRSHVSKVRTHEMLMHIRDFIWDTIYITNM